MIRREWICDGYPMALEVEGERWRFFTKDAVGGGDCAWREVLVAGSGSAVSELGELAADLLRELQAAKEAIQALSPMDGVVVENRSATVAELREEACFEVGFRKARDAALAILAGGSQ